MMLALKQEKAVVVAWPTNGELSTFVSKLGFRGRHSCSAIVLFLAKRLIVLFQTVSLDQVRDSPLVATAISRPSARFAGTGQSLLSCGWLCPHPRLCLNLHEISSDCGEVGIEL